MPLQYLVRFERDDPVPTAEIFKHPNAEDFDDYREYKRSIREQRDAEKAGAEMLNSKHRNTETYIARMKTMTDMGEGEQSKAANYMYKNGTIDISLEDPLASSVMSEDRDDGLGRLFKRSATTKSKKSQSQSRSYDGSHDGSPDEPSDGIDSRLHHAMSSDKGGDTSKQNPTTAEKSSTRSEDSSGSSHVSPTVSIVRTAVSPWNELFSEVNWNGARTGTRSRKLIEESKVSGSIEPTTTVPYTTAEARGAFEIARARKPLPVNAPAFLAALSRVFHDIAMPDYVAKKVIKEADV